MPQDDELTRVQPSPVQGLAGLTLCDRYHLDELIGSGGMAQVWAATDEVLGRRVAVKVLHPHLAGDQAFVARFRQEAVAAARLSNPGIVGVYDTCSDGVHEAIVMELLDASTLRSHLDEHGALDADTTVRIALRLLDALEAAHRAGLVHRDVKPSNILLCRDGRVKIADFGIAKADDTTELTQEGTLVGTATYLSPEQLLGNDVDGRADLYSLGIVLYECLTGRVPFHGDTGAAVALARLHSDPVDPRRVKADVPPRVAAAVMRSLQRDPDDRFDSAADLRAALLDTGIEPVVVVEETPDVDEPLTEETPSFARSQRGWLLPAMFILLVATAVTVAGLLLRETAVRSDGTSTSAPELTTPPPTPLAVDEAVPFDPFGTDGENDRLAPDAIDGDAASGWNTEGYDLRTFGTKSGVGLALELGTAYDVASVRIDGSTNGWNGEIHVVDAATPLSEFDPNQSTPAAEFRDMRGPRDLPLDSVGVTSGERVVIWITDLGEASDDGRHRVELREVEVFGSPAGGA